MSTDTLYRRNQDGMMETVIPEAQGKAAALSSYLAQGGTPFRNSGRFKKGPMKGKNVDEATAEFERKWASSPESLKQKYASRSSGATTDLAPSERPQISGVSPAPPKDMSAAGIQKRRMASYGHEFGPDGVARKIGAVSPTPAVGAKGSIAATPPRTAMKPVAKADEPETPAQRAAHGSEENGEYGKVPASSPAPPPVGNGSRPGLSPLAQRELANRKAAVDATPTGQPVVTKPAPGINRLTGLPFGYQPGDSQSPGSPVIDPTLAAQSVKRQEVATSKAAMAPKPITPKPIIGGITPMPRGPASQPSPTGSSLDNPNNAFSKEAYARTAAAEAKGVKRQEELSRAVNVDDPKKFFTGRVLPLDQLVKNQKASRIGTPAIR